MLRKNNLIFKESHPSVSNKTLNKLRNSINITPCAECLHIFAIAKKADSPVIGIEYKKAGVPLNGYVYDAVAEKFYCEGVDYLDVGIIPISFYITVGDNWKYPVPVPESVITDFLDKEQKKQLKAFKSKNKGCFFDYFQLMGCD